MTATDSFNRKKRNFAPYIAFSGEEPSFFTASSVFSGYGARYLESRTGRWLSADPAMGEYIPSSGQDSAKLPGLGGIYNTVNFHVYHYAGNNPVKYTDPDGRMPGDPFDTSDEAAIDALDYINPISIDKNEEYAGVIYKDPNTGKFYATEPKSKGSGVKSNPGSAPKGMDRVGDYHTHGDYSKEGPGGVPIRTSDPSNDSFNSDNFAKDDKEILDIRAKLFYPGLKGYLGTPSGDYKKYDPATGDISIINRQENGSAPSSPVQNYQPGTTTRSIGRGGYYW